MGRDTGIYESLLPVWTQKNIKPGGIRMNSRVPDLAWLENPEIFEVNREKAHSDHRFYESAESMKDGERNGGQMGLRQSLNGTWKFACAQCPDKREKEFYKESFDLSGMESDSGAGAYPDPGI